MDYVLLRATVRAPAAAEPAESLAVASGSGLGLGASSPAKTIDPLAALPGVMASQALAFVLRQSLGLYHSQLFYMWPDRLCAGAITSPKGLRQHYFNAA